MDFTRASRTQNLMEAYLSHSGKYFTLRHIKLHALTEVILELYEGNINIFFLNEKVRM